MRPASHYSTPAVEYKSVDRGSLKRRRSKMAAVAKALLVVQLMVLLFGCFTPSSDGCDAAGPSLTAISSPPSPPPPPPRPKKYHLAVEGVIYCSTCQLRGYNADVVASPLPGAVAQLKCYNITGMKRRPYVMKATTDSSGYFYFQASPKVSNFDIKQCRVFLVSSPLAICKKPSNFNGGVSGARLWYERIEYIEGRSVYALYTSGFLQYDPTNSTSCPVLPTPAV